MPSVGPACCLVAIDVFRAFEPPWFEMPAMGVSKHLWFCERMRASGFPIVVDARVTPGHLALLRITLAEFQRHTAQDNAKAFFSHLTPAKKLELEKRNIQSVLIPTVRSLRTSPQAKDVRMRYRIEGESLIDDYAYEFQTPLQAGKIAKPEGLEPEYVGK